MGALVLLFAIAVKHDQAPLRSGCGESESVVSNLPAGTPVEVRFVLSDGSDCYKIAATVNGKQEIGYVTAADLTGLDSFEQQRRTAPATFATFSAERAPEPPPIRQQSDPLLSNIVGLLNANQPGKALEHLEPLIKLNPHNPDVLMLAGFAAYRTDDVRRAMSYWKEALAQRPDEKLASFYRKVEKEAAADSSGDKLYGMRVALRYEGQSLPADVARSMVAVLDEEFIRISDQLGCPSGERIVAIVQSREAYLKATSAAEWSGGQYDGRIHVAMNEHEMGPQTRRTLAHEIVHACLANIGRFPAWLHEGLAQKLSGDTLSPAARERLQRSIEQHAVPKLENVRQDWSRMDAVHARLAYDLALAAADAVVDQHAAYGLRNIVHNPEILRHITPSIDKALGL